MKKEINKEILGIAVGDIITVDYTDTTYEVKSVSAPVTFHNRMGIEIYSKPVVYLTLKDLRPGFDNSDSYIGHVRQEGDRWFDASNEEIFVEQRGKRESVFSGEIPEYTFQKDCDYKAGIGKVWRCERCKKDVNFEEKQKLPTNCPVCLPNYGRTFSTMKPIFYFDFPSAEDRRDYPSTYSCKLNFYDYKASEVTYVTAAQHAREQVRIRRAAAAEKDMAKKPDEPNIPFNPKTGKCVCFRCGYIWQASKDADGKYIEIKLCRSKKCKSAGWNKPRVYGGKYTGGNQTIIKREAPTGRAAAKLRKVGFVDEVFSRYKSEIGRLREIGFKQITKDWWRYQWKNFFMLECKFDTEEHRAEYFLIEKSFDQVWEKYQDKFQSLEAAEPEKPFHVLAFEQFEPQMLKLHKQGFRSSCHDWWRSRWYDWLNFTGDDTVQEHQRKSELSQAFEKVWKEFNGRFTENLK